MTVNTTEEAMMDSQAPCPTHTSGTTIGDTDDGSISSRDKSMPIAVIGMGFRGPADATNVENLWKMILEGREGWGPIPKTKWNNSAFYHPDNARHGTINVEGGHFITEDVSLFDAPFFNMTGDEAAAMDPQQRLLLEVTYEGLENAGIPLPNVMGTKTSCFVGCFSADYMDLLLRDPESVPMYQCTNAGQSRAMTANRVSYFFDLKGPSVTVDTACSGSLVALHLACQSLRTGDASMAIAAGVNIILSHEFMSTMSMMKFLSPDGRCYTFDESANGYARGEGIGCLILKPLAHAIRDGDTIRAVIRGSGSNQDGRTPGITLPSGALQEVLIRDVYTAAGLNPLETEYIETHGTGTQAGDPIETGALSKVFGPGRPPGTPLRIGSIKTNVGHLEGTSGVAGVMKAILMLENRTFLPNRNFKTVNPRIPLQEWNLKVQLDPEPWETLGPHRVSVNSFGYGGSNAHIVLEDASGYLSSHGLGGAIRKLSQSSFPVQSSSNGEGSSGSQNPIPSEAREVNTAYRTRLFMVSGFDENSCSAQIKNLREYLIEKAEIADDSFMENLAYTLNERRSKFIWKAAVIGSSPSNVVDALFNKGQAKRAVKKPSIGFVFTGQGAQWCGMGKELYATYPVFRQSIERIDGFLSQIGAPFSVEEEILRSKDTSRLSRPLLSQPICSALQIALVDLLASWGIFPDSVTGHSSGEIAAAYTIGALCMEDAMSAAYHRGAVAGKLPIIGDVNGAMLAVGMSMEEIQPYLGNLRSGKVVVACKNSPSSLTISGDLLAVEELERLLHEKQIFARRLAVDVAYHSHHMELIGDEYHAAISHIKTRNEEDASYQQKISFFSSVRGAEVAASELGARYWVKNLLGQVKFVESLQTLCFETNTQKYGSGISNSKRTKRAGAARKVSIDYLIEIGPHSALAGPIKQTIKADSKLSAADIQYGSVLVRKADAVASALSLVASLATSGCSLAFDAVNRPLGTLNQEPQLLVDLPPYAWNHSTSYWAEPRLSKTFRGRKYPRMELLGVSDTISCPLEPRWRNFIRVSEIPWLTDHKIQSNIVYPAAGYIVMAIEASSQQVLGTSVEIHGYQLHEVSILSALVVNEISAVEIMVSLKPYEPPPGTEGKWFEFHIYSITDENRWTEHCNGHVGVHLTANNGETTAAIGIDSDVYPNPNQDPSILDVEKFYETLGNAGLEYGPCFANMRAAHYTDDKCFAEIVIPNTAASMPMNFQHPFVIHPCTLDSTFHSIFVPLLPTIGETEEPPVPVFIDEISVSRNINTVPGGRMQVQANIITGETSDIVASLTVIDSDSGSHSPAVSVSGLRCRRLAGAKEKDTTKSTKRHVYNVKWEADPDLLSRETVSKILDGGRVCPLSTSKKSALYEEYALNYIYKVLRSLTTSEVAALKPGVKRIWSFFTEMQDRGKVTGSTVEEVVYNADPGRLRNAGLKGQLLYAIGEKLSSFLKGEIDSSAFFDDPTLSTYWDRAPHLVQGYQTAARYLEIIGHKNPKISILEIGAGADGASLIYLQRLTGGGEIPRCAEYTFTSPVASVLENAARKLDKWQKWTSFKVLDVDSNFEDQGFLPNTYDVVIMSHGLYTSTSRYQALKSIRKLLRSNGHLICIEPNSTRDSLADNVIFGHFPGWWADDSKAAVNHKDEWDCALREARFSGVDALVGCKSAESEDTCSLIISHPLRERNFMSMDVLIVAEGDCGVSIPQLRDHLDQQSANVEIADLSDANPIGRICIVLSDLKNSIFAQPNRDTLEILKTIFLQSAGVVWVTRGGLINPVNPDAGLAMGFARTARSESGVSPIVTLDLDGQNPVSDERAAELICDVIRCRFLENNTPENDVEYAERDGVLLVPRVVENIQMNQAIASLHDHKIINEQAFHQKDRPLRAAVDWTEESENIYFVDDSSAKELPDGHVSIEIRAFSFNQQDSKKTLKFGSGCGGILRSVGRAVHDFAPGDRVACLVSGTVTSIYHDRGSAFQKVPAGTSFELAAALPESYCTAFYIVNDLARINSEDKVFILGAAETCGQAILEMCLLKNAEVIAAVTSESQRSILLSKFQLSGDRAFVDYDNDAASASLKTTQRNSVGIVINCHKHASRAARYAWKCIAPYGRFIQLGSEKVEPQRSRKDVTASSFDFQNLCKQDPDIVDKVWKRVMALFREGKLKGPSPLVSHSISNVSEILKIADLQANGNAVIITAGPDSVVQATLPKRSSGLFRPDASYVIVGGLGGIGRATALWMADHGARSLIFVNRSGMSNPASQSTIQALKEKGVNALVHACNVADQVQVQSMVSQLEQSVPPIRGVIQAAMVLRDIHIEKMTAEDYNAVLQPKHAATWNLHRFLPSDLDFFLMLSSISGVIGNATQAAYAAGSTFMDSFAAYRNCIGLPAVSLDLGVITDVGYLAENKELAARMAQQGFQGTDMSTLMTLIEMAITEPRREGVFSQVITGLGEWKEGQSLGNFDASLFAHFRHQFPGSRELQKEETAETLREDLRLAKNLDEASGAIYNALSARIAAHLSVPVESINPSSPISEYGIDSHSAVELRNWISKKTESTVPILEILASASLLDLASKIAAKSHLVHVEET